MDLDCFDGAIEAVFGKLSDEAVVECLHAWVSVVRVFKRGRFHGAHVATVNDRWEIFRVRPADPGIPYVVAWRNGEARSRVVLIPDEQGSEQKAVSGAMNVLGEAVHAVVWHRNR